MLKRLFSVRKQFLDLLPKIILPCTCRFELEYDAVVVIDTEVARASTKDIMAMHLVEHDRSLELRAPQAMPDSE